MKEEQQEFKDELAGDLEKRIFKAILQDNMNGIILDHTLRLIIPVYQYTSLQGFVSCIKDHPDFEYDHKRGHERALAYKGKPFLDIIAQGSVQFYDNWRIYRKRLNNIQCFGWTEMDEHRNLKKIYTLCKPVGKYEDDTYIRVMHDDGATEKTMLPPYNAQEPGVIVDVTRARRIDLCITAGGQEYCTSIPHLLGHGIERFTRGGIVVRFPAVWRPDKLNT